MTTENTILTETETTDDENTSEEIESPSPTEVVEPEQEPEAAVEGDKGEEAEGAPENYEDFNFPEGAEINKALLEQFSPVAKELNLTQEQAQKLVSFQANAELEEAKAQDDAFNDRINEYLKEAKSDKEIGGDKFETSVATALKALNHFGSPELVQFLDATGLGNNIHTLKFLNKIGTLVSEDKVHIGGNSGESRTHAEILFGSTSPN